MIKILLEGGLGGHMPHLYENGDLTFGELKNVFKQASKGQLKGTEKTDGQNIKLSFDVKKQKALGARNVTQIKSGGLTIEEMVGFFADHPNPNLKFAFSDAIKIFEKAAKLLDINKQIDIFGPNANNWYNAEVMDDRTRNVVNYDARNLLIHRTGHSSYDKTTGKLDPESDIDQKSDRFMSFLEKVQNTISDRRHAILVNPIQDLKALDNKEALRNAFVSVENVMSKYGLSDNNTINDLLRKDLNIRLKTQLPLEIKTLIIDGSLGLVPLSKRELKKQLPKELHSEVDSVIESLKTLKKDAIKPIETTVTDFAAEMLRTLESIFILDNKKETDRLAKEVDVAIKAIQSSGKQGDLDFLNRQLEKLKGVDTISSAVEGFAFSYKGTIYKFTGKFAPVNQILGLSKYGRGSKSSDNEELTEQQTGTGTFDIALLGGGFKPPHKGHIALIKQLASQADRVIIFTSDKAGKDRNFASGELKGQIIDGKKCNDFLEKMIAAIPALNNVEIKITNKPLTDIYQYVEKESKFGESILIGVGDKEDDAKRFDTLGKYTPAEKQLQVQILPLKPVEFNGEPLSATRLREAISNRNVDRVATFIPEEIPNKLLFAEEMIDSFFGIKSEMLQKKDLKQDIFDEVFNIFTNKDKVEEISTMAGGNVTISPALITRKKKMIDRKVFMEEIELRKTIRKALLLREKKKKDLLQQEQLLRKELRKIIKEAKQDFNYGNTGLNKLGAFLQVKKPLISAEYKQLQTDKAQRDAFKARLLQSSKELFDELEAKLQAGKSASPELEEEINVSIDEPVDDKLLPGLFDPEQEKKPKKKDTEQDFKVEPTGEREASEFFQNYEGELTDIYTGLDNPTDRQMFRDYYMSNIAAIMDQAEAEVGNVAKPVDTTPPEGAQQTASEPTPDQKDSPVV
jgi:cytidyltransferase-like protein